MRWIVPTSRTQDFNSLMPQYKGSMIKWLPLIRKWRREGFSWNSIARLLYELGAYTKVRWRNDRPAAEYALKHLAIHALKSADNPESPKQIPQNERLRAKVAGLLRRVDHSHPLAGVLTKALENMGR
jgi:DNA-binding transcriptional MerR regulator